MTSSATGAVGVERIPATEPEEAREALGTAPADLPARLGIDVDPSAVGDRLSGVAPALGPALVHARALRAHDDGRYADAARLFATLAGIAYPIDDAAAARAGAARTLAFLAHDAIEDGLPAVRRRLPGDADALSPALAAPDDRPPLHDDPRWGYVRLFAGLEGDAIGADDAYAGHETRFYRYHTLLTESEATATDAHRAELASQVRGSIAARFRERHDAATISKAADAYVDAQEAGHDAASPVRGLLGLRRYYAVLGGGSRA